MKDRLATWAVFYAEYEDLDNADPLRPAAVVHLPGRAGAACYAALDAATPTYVIGRGQLPGGSFVTAALVDYPTLLAAVRPFWPAMPATAPRRPARRTAGRQLYTQELADVNNYLGQPAGPDATIRDEARHGLTGRLPAASLEAAVTACAWLVEYMQPRLNCYTLAALLARWLHAHDVPAAYCVGTVSYATVERVRSVAHAWVELGGRILDLTVNAQGWGDLGAARLHVTHPQLRYAAGSPAPGQSLADVWARFSKPASRPGYTAASLARQDALIRRQLPPALYQERQEWLAAVRNQGVLAGTLNYLLRLTG